MFITNLMHFEKLVYLLITCQQYTQPQTLTN